MEFKWKPDHRDLLIVAVLIVLWGLFCWRYLTLNPADRVAFPPGDFSHHYYVYRVFAYRELSADLLYLPALTVHFDTAKLADYAQK